MAAPTTTTVTMNNQPDLTRRHKFLNVAIQLTDGGAPTYITGGLTVDLTTLVNNLKVPRGGFPAGALPANQDIICLQCPAGYDAYLVQNGSSPTLKNYLLKIFASGGAEHAAAALNAALFGATVGASPFIIFRFRFKNWQ